MVGSAKLDMADNRLKEFEVLEQIGKGAFGEVFIIQTRRAPKDRFVLKKVKLARQSERQRFMSRQEMHLVAGEEGGNIGISRLAHFFVFTFFFPFHIKSSPPPTAMND